MAKADVLLQVQSANIGDSKILHSFKNPFSKVENMFSKSSSVYFGIAAEFFVVRHGSAMS